jgi:hypothetical protein
VSASENRQRTKLVGVRMRDEDFEILERERVRQNFASVQELILSRQPEIRTSQPRSTRARLQSAG